MTLVGRRLGDFVVREKIGEGGFGAVYRAEQESLAREAVIKVLHTHLRSAGDIVQRSCARPSWPHALIALLGTGAGKVGGGPVGPGPAPGGH